MVVARHIFARNISVIIGIFQNHTFVKAAYLFAEQLLPGRMILWVGMLGLELLGETWPCALQAYSLMVILPPSGGC